MTINDSGCKEMRNFLFHSFGGQMDVIKQLSLWFFFLNLWSHFYLSRFCIFTAAICVIIDIDSRTNLNSFCLRSHPQPPCGYFFLHLVSSWIRKQLSLNLLVSCEVNVLKKPFYLFQKPIIFHLFTSHLQP